MVSCGQQQPYLTQQIVGQTRLRQEQIAAGLQRALAFDAPCQRSEHDDREIARASVRAQTRDEIESGELAAQANAGHDDV
jgi:hypothetical protein